MPPAAPPPVDVAAAIIVHDGRYLIAQRRTDAPLGGYWEFPGGKCRVGESLAACLQREVREEVGVEITVLDALERTVYRYPHATVDIRFFRCRILRGTPQAIGCADLRWIRPAQFTAHRFPPANERILQRLVEGTV